MKRVSVHRVFLLALLGFVLAYSLPKTQLGLELDQLTYDSFVRLREEHQKSPEVDSRLVIVEIDEKSRQAYPQALALWMPLYGKMFQTLFQNGAEYLGFDIIPTNTPMEEIAPYLETFLNNRGKMVFVEFYDSDTERLIVPTDNIMALVGAENLALSNLLKDSGGLHRRQPLTNWQIKNTGHPFFAPLLYEKLTGKTELPRKSLLINFVGPPGTIPRVSFSDVLAMAEHGESEKLRQLFEGKLVLLGGTAMADQDFVDTPFPSDKPMPGIELHANILNTLLTEQWLDPLKAWPLLALVLVPLAWVSLEKKLVVSTGSTAALCLCWLGGSYMAFLKGQVVEPVPSALAGFLTTYFLGYLYRFNTVEKEQRRIRSVFGRYVSPDVMEAMLEFPEDHKPEEAKSQRVTVMFSDINDFSTACEQLEPEEVTRRLNAYFGEMTNIIYAHQGTIGDEFMILFGAPKANDKSEEQAVLTAVKMVDRLDQLKAKDSKGTEGFYEVKIGIHVGDMILTSIGNELRSDYNCIGDSTNMAARVLSLTKPLGATVLISEDVKTKVESHPELDFKDLGVHPVKGRQGEIRVFEAFLKKA